MSINYYFYEKTKPACECCKRPYPTKVLHVGKSSAGWCFALHVEPEEGINDLADWMAYFDRTPGVIKDEYNREVTRTELMKEIQNRSWYGAFPQRHNLDGSHCIGHGEGTWDLITGEFS